MTGITVILHEKTQTGTDSFNNQVFSENTVSVENVLVDEPTADDVVSSTNMYGKQIIYMLGIPKGDTHNWENAEVEFFGNRYRTFGHLIQGIEANVPTKWHKKIRVERYG